MMTEYCRRPIPEGFPSDLVCMGCWEVRPEYLAVPMIRWGIAGEWKGVREGVAEMYCRHCGPFSDSMIGVEA